MICLDPPSCVLRCVPSACWDESKVGREEGGEEDQPDAGMKGSLCNETKICHQKGAPVVDFPLDLVALVSLLRFELERWNERERRADVVTRLTCADNVLDLVGQQFGINQPNIERLSLPVWNLEIIFKC
jgi:hypothetical protein